MLDYCFNYNLLIKDNMEKKFSIPSERDWGNSYLQDLDIKASYDDFFGKSNDEMQVMFSQCVIAMADSLRWMPRKPFEYYIIGFAEFILKGQFNKFDASDVASSFLNLIEEKLSSNQLLSNNSVEKILLAVQFIMCHQFDLFMNNIEIYGDFKVKGEKIIHLIKS